MDEKSDQIINQIEAQRSQLGQNLNELESRVRRSADWRTHFDNNPTLMVGAALGGGLLLGAIVGGGKSSRSRSSYTSSRHFSASSEAPTANTATAIQRHRASEAVDHIKGALIAFATAKAKEFLSEAIPGFQAFMSESESKGSGLQGSEAFSSSGYGKQQSYDQQGYGQPRQAAGNYDQRPSGSSQGANYGQNAGQEVGSPRGYENSVNRP